MIGVFAALAAAEGYLRLTGYAPLYRGGDAKFSVALDRRLLHRLPPHSRPDINALGFREREIGVKPAGTRRFLMLGDSFVMADNVPSESRMSRRLEALLEPGAQVVNMGIHGYGPDQSYLRLVDDGLQLDPDGVILVLFAGNDFNDLVLNELFLPSPGRPEVWVYNQDNPAAKLLPRLRLPMALRQALLGAPLPPKEAEALFYRAFLDRYDLLIDPNHPVSARKIAAMRSMLRHYASTLGKARIPFWIVILPSFENIQDDTRFRAQGIPPEVYRLNESVLEGLCAEAGIAALNLTQPFLDRRDQGLYDPVDFHLSVAGNRYAAELIRAYITARSGASRDGGEG